MNRIKNIYELLIEEIQYLAKYPLPLLVPTVIPLIAWLILVLAFSHPIMQDIPIIIVDKDNSTLSRTIARQLDASQNLKVVKIMKDEEDSKKLMLEGKSILNIYIPENSEKNIKNGHSTNVFIMANGTALMYTKISYRSIATVLSSISSSINIKRLQASGLKYDEALARSSPISVQIHALGNPWYDYSIYLVPGMAIAIFQLAAAFSCLWLFRKKTGYRSDIEQVERGKKFNYFISKIIPIILANSIGLLILYIFILPACGFTINDSFLKMFELTSLYILVSMGMGALSSLVFSNFITAVQINLLINAPAFVFSGFTFPKWAMPELLRLLSNIMPISHFIDGFIPMFIFNSPTSNGIQNLIILGCILWIPTFIIYIFFNKKKVAN